MKFPDRTVLQTVEIEGAGEFDIVLERRGATVALGGSKRCLIHGDAPCDLDCPVPVYPTPALNWRRLEAAMHKVGEDIGADPACPQLYPSDARAIAAAYEEAAR